MLDLSQNERVQREISTITEKNFNTSEDIKTAIESLVSILKEEIEKELQQVKAAKEMQQENELEWGRNIYS